MKQKVVIKLINSRTGGEECNGILFCYTKGKQKILFKLIPGNNGSQEIGASIGYDNYCDCKKALEYFKEYVASRKINQNNLCNTKIENIDGKYTFKYFDQEENLLFQRRKLYGKNIL